MRKPGPYDGDNWDWLPYAMDRADAGWAKAAHAAREAASENSPGRVLGELGVVLLVPLAGAAIVELVLRVLQIY